MKHKDRVNKSSNEFFHNIDKKYSKYNIELVEKHAKAETKHRNFDIEFNDKIFLMPYNFNDMVEEWNPSSIEAQNLTKSELFPGLLLLNKRSKKLTQVLNFIPREEVNDDEFSIVVTIEGMSPILTHFFVFLWNQTVDIKKETFLFPTISTVVGNRNILFPSYDDLSLIAIGLEILSPNPFLVIPKIKFMKSAPEEVSADNSNKNMENPTMVNRLLDLIDLREVVNNELNNKQNYSKYVLEAIGLSLSSNTRYSLIDTLNELFELYSEKYVSDRNITSVIIYLERLLLQIEEFVSDYNESLVNFLLSIEDEETLLNNDASTYILQDFFYLLDGIIKFVELTVDLESMP